MFFIFLVFFLSFCSNVFAGNYEIKNHFKNQPKDVTNQINDFLDDKSKTNFGIVNKIVNNHNKEGLNMLKNYYDSLPYQKISTYDKFIKNWFVNLEVLYNFSNFTENKKLIMDILSTKKGQDFIIQKSRTEQENKRLWMFAIKNNDMDLLTKLSSLDIRMALSKVELVNIVRSLVNVPNLIDIRSFIIDYIQQKQNWKQFIRNNDIQKLKEFKSKGIPMQLTNDELIKIITLFRSVNFYETFELLLDYIILDQVIAQRLIRTVLWHLKTPNSKIEQKIQFDIVKKMIVFSTAKHFLENNFDEVLWSLNIPLVDFYIDIFKYDINRLFYSRNVLQWTVDYLNCNPNINNNFAYEMFDHLLTKKGIDINRSSLLLNDIYFDINRLNGPIKNVLLQKLATLKLNKLKIS